MKAAWLISGRGMDLWPRLSRISATSCDRMNSSLNWTSLRERNYRGWRRRKKSAAARDGVLGCAAVLHRHGVGAEVDRGGGAQRAIVHQFMDIGGAAVFCSHSVHRGRAFHAISGRGRAVRVDENGLRRFSRIRGRMDVLDLHGVF